MFQVLFFFVISCKMLCKNRFNSFFKNGSISPRDPSVPSIPKKQIRFGSNKSVLVESMRFWRNCFVNSKLKGTEEWFRSMAIQVVEFSNEGYKIRKIFA